MQQIKEEHRRSPASEQFKPEVVVFLLSFIRVKLVFAEFRIVSCLFVPMPSKRLVELGVELPCRIV